MNHDLIVPALEGGIPVLAGLVLMLLASDWCRQSLTREHRT